MRSHLVLAWIDNVGARRFVDRPIIVLSAIAVATAVVKIGVFTFEFGETVNTFGAIVIDAKVQVWRTAVRLATVHAKSREFIL